METKRVKAKKKDAEDVINHYAHFGYKLIETNECNDKVELVFERIEVECIRELQSVERRYNKLNEKAPFTAFIWIGASLICLTVYLILVAIPATKDWAFIALPFMFAGFGVATFLIIIFIVCLCNKNNIRKSLVHRADILSGVIKQYPEGRNIEPPTEQTWTIRNNIDDILNKNSR